MDKKAVDKNWVATQFLAFREKILSEISQMHESSEEEIEAIVNGTFADSANGGS